MATAEAMEQEIALGVIQDEFADVPNNPIWLLIASFMYDEERERIFPNIPELKGIERLAEAQVVSQHVRKHIESIKCSHRDTAEVCFSFEESNTKLLFPEGLEKLVADASDPANMPDFQEEEVDPSLEVKDTDTPEEAARKIKIKREIERCNEKGRHRHEWAWRRSLCSRMEEALCGKEHLYCKDPTCVTWLDVSGDEKELWFSWGADKSSFVSAEKFEQFCALAGVDCGKEIVQVRVSSFDGEINHTSTSWISRDRKVVFTRYGGYFGLTGIRPRAKYLFEWFKKEGVCDEYCWNGRNFI